MFPFVRTNALEACSLKRNSTPCEWGFALFLTKQYRVFVGTMRRVNDHVIMVICTCETNSLTLSANLHAIDLQTQ